MRGWQRSPAPGRRRSRSCARISAFTRSTSASTPAPRSSLRPPPTCIQPTRRRSGRFPTTRRGRSDRDKVIILGGGPNRIGQGIEFDYCCCHAAFALAEAGIESIMVNCNPETVSTDYDTSDRLYFESLTVEDVLEIVARRALAGTRARRHRAVRRADAAEAGACAAGGRRADPRDLAGHDRPRRGPRPVQGAAGQAGPAPAGERRGALGGGGAPGGGAHRLSRGHPAVLRAGRAGHGDRPRRGAARALHDGGRRGLRRVPGAHRQLSVGRHRGGCRRAVGRHRRVRLRSDGAHRGSRHPFRRFRLLAAAGIRWGRRSSPRSSGRRSPWHWP